MLSVENLSCRRLSRPYGGRFIFRNLGFTLAAGGFLQVMGANGSGKSTLLRLMAGLLPPTSGSISEIKSCYIGHLDAVKPALTASEMLHYWGALRGVSVNIPSLSSSFELEPLLGRPIRFLSAGQKRRLSLTRLLLDASPLWLLDEPTTALDAVGRNLLFAAIAQHRAAGGMIIAATHEIWDLAEAQYLKMGEVQ